eukprot:12916967-Prorocentrum_lima.AAC.1
MASLNALLAFGAAVVAYGVRLEWKPCNTMMSFTNQKDVLEWCVLSHFPTTPSVHAAVDIHETSDIPMI